MENNDRGSLLPEKDTRIQLVVNQQDGDDDTIDLGRVFHNMKVKARIFAWVLVLCILAGACVPLLLYQLKDHPLVVSSVVTLRYDAPNPEYEAAEEEGDTEAMKRLKPVVPVYELITPDGEDLDPTALMSSSILQEAVGSLNLSSPVSLEGLRANISITRVLTEESSRTREVLAGLAEAKNSEAYNRLSNAEIRYQNRFIVSLTNGFTNAGSDAGAKVYLTDEELRILLNRILDAYNTWLSRQYADFTTPGDRASLIDTEELDLPETLDSLNTILDELLAYCEGQPETVRAYRSWQTGMSLDDWAETVRTVRSVSTEYLEADVYSRGLIRSRDAVRITFSYRLRTLQAELDRVTRTIAETEALLQSYRNDEVFVSMQESDGERRIKMTTDYYNSLVVSQQEAYAEAAKLRIRIAELEDRLERLEAAGTASPEDLVGAEADVAAAVETVRELQDGIRAHMAELFESPLFTSYSEHSAPQGEPENFLKTSLKKIILGVAAGVVIACGLWFLAALAPEFRKDRKEDKGGKAPEEGKEAAEA